MGFRLDWARRTGAGFRNGGLVQRMRRRRPAENPADSLELLLDTICNTFGGVLFIALLVALLTHVPAADRPQPAEGTLNRGSS